MIEPGLPGETLLQRLGHGFRRLTPMAYRLQRTTRQMARRAMRKPRTVIEGPNLLPLLIQVLAAFSKVDGVVLEEEIDSSLGFLRYDYPEAVYSELRKLFRQALNEQHDLMAMAQKLSTQLTEERKIMLGVQLYDLISKNRTPTRSRSRISTPSCPRWAWRRRPSISSTSSTRRRMWIPPCSSAAPRRWSRSASGTTARADVVLRDLEPDERLLVFRYNEVILLKNQTKRPIVVRGPAAGHGAFLPGLSRAADRAGGAGAGATRTSFTTSTRRRTSRSRTSIWS